MTERTFLGTISKDLRPGTKPKKVDSDGDGWWDGWIGVYDVGRTDNVVLYMEHLVDEDDSPGVSGEEVVEEQTGVHSVEKAPSAMGADLPAFDDPVHSNLHIGELQWGTDPTPGTGDESVPSPRLSIEVDYYHGADYQAVARPSWRNGIEENYALYGIQVTMVEDEVLRADDFQPCIPMVVNFACVDPENGFGFREVAATGLYHQSTGADEYLLVANKAGGLVPGGENQSGINIPGTPYQAVFIEGNQRFANNVPSDALSRSPYESELAMVAAKTEVHEIAHSFEIGKDDDDLLEHPFRLGEVYSGSGDDQTPERIRSGGSKLWSVMTSGWDDDLLIHPMSGRYFAYTIQEVATVAEP